MISVKHQPMWEKLLAFQFDEPGTAITFTDKLARQQKWSKTFTERAIEEYRKFILLCCISPNGASPSKVVDEVWHLHLTYTHSYWTNLCKQVLEKDIHHHPSKGGDTENHRHEDWYKQTKILYTEVFGENPPADIWPGPSIKSEDIPLSKVKTPYLFGVVIVLLLAAPFVFSKCFYDHLNPFKLNGPHFLQFFVLLIGAGLLARWMVQKANADALGKLVKQYFPQDISPLQACWYIHGKERTLQASIIDMVQRGIIECRNKKLFFLRDKAEKIPNEYNPLLPYLRRKGAKEIKLKDVRKKFQYDDYQHAVMNQIRERCYKGLRNKGSVILKYIIAFIVIGIGVARVMQGMSNGKPVSFLIGLIVIYILCVGLVEFFGTVEKTFANICNEQYASREETALTRNTDSVVADFVLLGSSALMTMPLYSDLPWIAEAALMEESKKNNWGDTSSSDSGSSCSSGGSSCGGGGGCGGCSGSD